MSAFPLELGLNSFGDVPTDGGRTLSDAETVRLLIEEAKLAESVGLDIFSIGEHYREGFVDSAGAVILAGIATATSRIKLGPIELADQLDREQLEQRSSISSAITK